MRSAAMRGYQTAATHGKTRPLHGCARVEPSGKRKAGEDEREKGNKNLGLGGKGEKSTNVDCAHRASILRSKIDARPWAISINQPGCDREKVFLDFLDLARAHRGLFRRCSQQGVQNGPRPPRYAYCRSRGGCRRSATAEVWLRRASVRPPD